MNPIEQAREALEAILDHYVNLANSGDAGFWNPEEEPEVIGVRAALAALSASQAHADLLKLEALADAYAKAAATAHVESLYGGSKDYTRECVGKSNKARSDLMQALSAAPAAPTQGAQWMPIETAPKDGRMFLCWVTAVRYGETDDGQQYQQDASECSFCWWRAGPDADSGYFDAACGQIADSQAVTHWQPIPTPPQG